MSVTIRRLKSHTPIKDLRLKSIKCHPEENVRHIDITLSRVNIIVENSQENVTTVEYDVIQWSTIERYNTNRIKGIIGIID